MQHPTRGYRGGIRVGHHFTHIHSMKDNDDSISLSNSNSDEKNDENNNENDITLKSKYSSHLSSIPISTDFESALRNLRPLTTHQKKIKTNPNISNQKADLPQMNTFNIEILNNINEQKENKQLYHWFPKPDIGHVNSNDFIRHNHIGKSMICF